MSLKGRFKLNDDPPQNILVRVVYEIVKAGAIVILCGVAFIMISKILEALGGLV